MFKTNLINKKVDAIVHDLLENKTFESEQSSVRNVQAQSKN